MRQSKRSRLEQGSGSHSHAAAEDSPSPTKWIANKDSQDGAAKTAQIVRCDRNALVQATL